MTEDGGSVVPDTFWRQLKLSMGFGDRVVRDGMVFVYESDLHSVPFEVTPVAKARGTGTNPFRKIASVVSVTKETLEDSGHGGRRVSWEDRERAAIAERRRYRARLTDAIARTVWDARKALAHRIYPLHDYWADDE